jgi:hypothetical protein
LRFTCISFACTEYGVVDQIALNKMEEIITTPLDTVVNYDKHLARLRQYILMQTAACYPIEEYRKVRIFRKTVGGHHQITQCLADYDRLNPDPLVHTFAAITAYVATHLPNVQAAADIASPAGQVFAATTASVPASGVPARGTQQMSLAELQCACSVLEYKHSNLQKQNQRGKAKADKNAKRHKGADKGIDSTPVTRKEDMTYCHAHGYQTSHTSAQCKVMAGQPQNFTAEMRRATTPHNPPGGSQLIRGRRPEDTQATGSANMMKATTTDKDENDMPPHGPPAGAGPSIDHNPSAGFAGQPAAVQHVSHEDESSSSLPVDEATRLYARAFASNRPEPGESNAESVERPRQIEAFVQAAQGDPTQETHGQGRYQTAPRSSFFDEEYVGGRRVPSPSLEQSQSLTATDRTPSPPTRVSFPLREKHTTTFYRCDVAIPEDCCRMSARILKSLEIDNDKPDFQERHIPSPEQNLQVHNKLHFLLAARRETNSDLEELMTDHH